MNRTKQQKADPETYELIRGRLYSLDKYIETYACDPSNDEFLLDVDETLSGASESDLILAGDIIQGCLQRAIEKRGWTWSMDCNNHRGVSLDIYIEETDEPDSEMQMLAVSRIETSSPAEALLSAYLEALHETS